MKELKSAVVNRLRVAGYYLLNLSYFWVNKMSIKLVYIMLKSQFLYFLSLYIVFSLQIHFYFISLVIFDVLLFFLLKNNRQLLFQHFSFTLSSCNLFLVLNSSLMLISSPHHKKGVSSPRPQKCSFAIHNLIFFSFCHVILIQLMILKLIFQHFCALVYVI